MEKKYKSEILQVIHEDAVGNFEVGAIDAQKMKEFDKMCLVEEAPVNPRPVRVPSATVYAGKR
ncbi:MAG: XRE family transcriptional regulator [Treponema sp.]|jgi:DNA-binding transcriptional regulator YiaG|nr:XRE family transcriptional regulator [Treponema sp.]